MTKIASSVLMIEPNTFDFDEQTAKTNAFQHHIKADRIALSVAATHEYEAVRAALQDFGVAVTSYVHMDGVRRPNAVFPNNWLTTWPDGKVYLYPMATPSRRLERTDGVLDRLRQDYSASEIVDLTASERAGRYLEGTGVAVFDHAHKMAYACTSVRCDAGLFADHVRDLGYQPVIFQAQDHSGAPIYHTNVMMGVQSVTAVLCAEAIADLDERQRVVWSLQDTGHEVVEINYEQMLAYCGNVIELSNARGERCLLLSQSAYDAFTPKQRAVLSRDKKLLPVAVPIIQAVGGGGVRCMVAEIFLPVRVEARVGR